MAPTRGWKHMSNLARRGTNGLKTPQIVGIAVALSLLAVIASAITLSICIRRRRRVRPGKPSRHSSPQSTTTFPSFLRYPKRDSQHLPSIIEPPKFDEPEKAASVKLPKYWSAEDISRSKIGSVKSHAPSVTAFHTDSDIFKPPPTPEDKSPTFRKYAPSIFSSKTKVSAFMNPDGTPQVIRPSSRRVRTWSRHISMQFMAEMPEPDLGVEAAIKAANDANIQEESPVSLKDMLEQQRRTFREVEGFSTSDKRNSRAVVTNLDWMMYESPK